MEARSKKYFVTAIGTDSGKTLVSAILAYKLKAAYWKPIQCGLPGDSDQFRIWLGEPWPVLPERFRLKAACSPHLASRMEQIRIDLNDFKLSAEPQNLVIEGAGGLLVPLNEKDLMADLIHHINIPIVLVVNHYLGSINHTLLTLSEIKRRNMPIAGIVFNGADFQESEALILEMAECPCFLRLAHEPELNLEIIHRYADLLNLFQ